MAGNSVLSEQRVRPVDFAGIHIGFAGVTGRVDQEIRLGAAQQVRQHLKPGVVGLGAGRGVKRDAARGQFPRKSWPM